MQFLTVDQLSKSYDNADFPALHPLSFSVSQGEILTILGESGSGKTTLLKLLAGLLDPDSGSIDLSGQAIKGPFHKLVPGYESIRVINQGFLLSPNMRVWENLRYHLLRTPRAYQDRRIEELIQLCRLEGLAERYPRELSGGQQQRVAIGRALANKPKLLLLDEPFSNLDVILKQQLIEELTTIIRNTGTTAIFVMHNPYDALRISDRIGVIKSGKIIQLASPQELYDQPKGAYVAQLFGNPTFINQQQLEILGVNEIKLHNKVMCIREHMIALGKDEGSTMKAEVSQLQFQGNYWKAVLSVEGEINFHANIPRDSALQIGNHIKITVDWKQAHIFDNEGLAN